MATIQMTGCQYLLKELLEIMQRKAFLNHIFNFKFINYFLPPLQNEIRHISFFKKIFLLLFVVIYFVCAPNANSDSGIGRTRTCDLSDGSPEGLDFDRFNGGKDCQFVLTNPTCASVISYAYGSTKIAIAAMNSMCGTGSAVPRVLPSPLLDSIDIAKASLRTTPNCQAGVTAATQTLNVTIGILYTIYKIADHVNNTSSVCGSEWVAPNPKKFANNAPKYKATIENRIKEILDNSDDEFRKNKLDFINKDYREWYYGGIEIVDDPIGDNQCPDVYASKTGPYPPQKYYLKGLETGNYNCKKYDILSTDKDPFDNSELTPSRLQDFRNAHECCLRRSQQYICINYDGTRKFCKANSKCEIKGIYFETKTEDNGAFVCAQTYSLCPYNFLLGGGSKKCDYFQDGIQDSNGNYKYISVETVTSGDCTDKSEIRKKDCKYNEKANRCKNYCQLMAHCTKTNNLYKYRSSITSPYFSAACLNFKGDSKNQISYGTGFIAGSARHFTAPIAQCTKETLENVFHNRAGHTRCISESESPNSNQQCPSGQSYKKGDKVKNFSFFEKIQIYIINVIKLVITLSITFLGMKVMTARGEIKKSELMVYILKIGIIMFFVTGDAWQKYFFDGIYNTSSVMSQIVFKIQMPDEANKRDGCQFGPVKDSNGNPLPDQILYSKGQEYISLWDTIDCKIARYMGFGPEISSANIAKLILAGFITGPIGLYFSISLFIFAMFIISLAIRALHIFLSSCLAIIILIYMSPITITCILFDKTKNIFSSWLGKLISYSLQPMILFAYVAIFISIMDKTVTGSATFYGKPPFKTISCEKYCQNSSGSKVDLTVSPGCDRVGEKMVKPKSDSLACLIDTNTFANFPGLELIGISIPFILAIFDEDPKQKILTIIRSVLILYLLYKFMDQIPSITTQLVGGGLPGSTSDPLANLDKLRGMLRGIQKRAGRGALKLGKKTAKSSYDAIKKGAADSGNKGKKDAPETDQRNAVDSSASSTTSTDSTASSTTSADGSSSTPPNPDESEA